MSRPKLERRSNYHYNKSEKEARLLLLTAEEFIEDLATKITQGIYSEVRRSIELIQYRQDFREITGELLSDDYFKDGLMALEYSARISDGNLPCHSREFIKGLNGLALYSNPLPLPHKYRIAIERIESEAKGGEIKR